jgi:hypothetical protein
MFDILEIQPADTEDEEKEGGRLDGGGDNSRSVAGSLVVDNDRTTVIGPLVDDCSWSTVPNPLVDDNSRKTATSPLVDDNSRGNITCPLVEDNSRRTVTNRCMDNNSSPSVIGLGMGDNSARTVIGPVVDDNSRTMIGLEGDASICRTMIPSVVDDKICGTLIDLVMDNNRCMTVIGPVVDDNENYCSPGGDEPGCDTAGSGLLEAVSGLNLTPGEGRGLESSDCTAMLSADDNSNRANVGLDTNLVKNNNSTHDGDHVITRSGAVNFRLGVYQPRRRELLPVQRSLNAVTETADLGKTPRSLKRQHGKRYDKVIKNIPMVVIYIVFFFWGGGVPCFPLSLK